MPTALIFGGSGKIARHLTRLLIKDNYSVCSIVRNPNQCEFLTTLGSHPIVQSIEDSSTSEFASTVREYNPNVVIWLAGASTGGYGDPARHRSISRDGAIKAIDALFEVGYKKRYIIVSSIDLRDRSKTPYPIWYDSQDKAISDKVWKEIPAYMDAKFVADKELVTGNTRRELEYTIIRPNLLTQDPGTGKISAGKVHLVMTITREDVAAVILACIKDDRTIGFAFDVTNGDVSVEEAVGKVVETRKDTFEGLY